MQPACGILRDYEYQLTAVRWTTQQENNELIMVGDEMGNVLTLDPRSPKKILNTKRVSKRPITKFSFNGTNKFGVLSKSNISKIFQIDCSGDLKELHKHSAPGIVYGMCWDELEKNTFYVVGEKKYAKKITVGSSE